MKRENKTKERIKAITLGIGAILVLVVTIVLIVIFNQPQEITGDYFTTDDTKIVIAMPEEITALESSEYEPEITRFVYFHDGTNITSVKVYYEYVDEARAAEAFDKVIVDDFATSKMLQGKYIVMDAKPERFEDATVEDIRKTANDLEAAGATVEE